MLLAPVKRHHFNSFLVQWWGIFLLICHSVASLSTSNFNQFLKNLQHIIPDSIENNAFFDSIVITQSWSRKTKVSMRHADNDIFVRDFNINWFFRFDVERCEVKIANKKQRVSYRLTNYTF